MLWMIAILFALVISLSEARSEMTDEWFPADNVTETQAPGHLAEFDACREILSDLASRQNLDVGELAFSYSEEWGHVLRAIIVSEKQTSARFVCWKRPNEERVAFVVDYS